jgi:hypothetical protein
MRPIFVILTLLTVVTLVSSGAVAQANNSTSDGPTVQVGPVDQEQPCETTERIDNSTVLCAAELNGGYAELIVRSDIRQRIVLTDAAGFMQGGEINRQRYLVESDEPYRLRMSVTSYRNFAGVTVDTGDVLYAVPLDEPTTLVGGPYSSQDVQLSAIGGALSIAVVSLLVTIRAVTGRADSPERIA